MKTTIGRLRVLVKETLTDDVGGPTLAWDEWYEELDLAAGDAGYELLSDLPVYDSIISHSPAFLQMEKVLVQMWKDGISPTEAVAQMEDPRTFWSKWRKWVPGNMAENGRGRWLREAKVGASADYLKKERVREELQDMITGMVSSGQLRDQHDLDEAFGALDMSVKALKMVPFVVWQKMAASDTRPPKR